MGKENNKYGEHPIPFQELSDCEPRCFERFSDVLAVSRAFGSLEIPTILKNLTDSVHGKLMYQSLRVLAEIIRDPEKALQAIKHGVVFKLAYALESSNERIARESLAVLEELSKQPQGKLAIVRSEVTMSRLKNCFHHSLKVLRNASQTLHALSTNHIAVDDLLKEGCVELLTKKLMQMSGDYDMIVEQEITLVHLLKTLSNLIEFNETAKMDAVIHGAFQLRSLYAHPATVVRTAASEFLSLLALTEFGIMGIAGHEMKGLLLRNFKHASKKDDMSEMSTYLSNLLLASTPSHSRRSYANLAFVEELFSILPLSDSPKLLILQLLTNLAEVPKMRGRITDRLKTIHNLIAKHCGENEKACLDNLTHVLGA